MEVGTETTDRVATERWVARITQETTMESEALDDGTMTTTVGHADTISNTPA